MGGGADAVRKVLAALHALGPFRGTAGRGRRGRGLGGYTADGEGSAEGIGVLHAGAPDSALAGGDLAFAGVAARTGKASDCEAAAAAAAIQANVPRRDTVRGASLILALA